MMLVHLGLTKQAGEIHNAWLKTLEDGIHTYDIFKEGVSKQKVGTQEFAEAVITRLGQKPTIFKEIVYTKPKALNFSDVSHAETTKKETVGVDIFVEHFGEAEELGKKMQAQNTDHLKLKMIANRGSIVWPTKHPETSCIDSWRCRYVGPNKGASITHEQIVTLLSKLAKERIDFIHTENLCTFNGVAGYTLTQDEQ